jgi:hypothetical protein
MVCFRDNWHQASSMVEGCRRHCGDEERLVSPLQELQRRVAGNIRILCGEAATADEAVVEDQSGQRHESALGGIGLMSSPGRRPNAKWLMKVLFSAACGPANNNRLLDHPIPSPATLVKAGTHSYTRSCEMTMCSQPRLKRACVTDRPLLGNAQSGVFPRYVGRAC